MFDDLFDSYMRVANNEFRKKLVKKKIPKKENLLIVYRFAELPRNVKSLIKALQLCHHQPKL
jgi:hypothetical protein